MHRRSEAGDWVFQGALRCLVWGVSGFWSNRNRLTTSSDMVRSATLLAFNGSDLNVDEIGQRIAGSERPQIF